MAKHDVARCPNCERPLSITELTCGACGLLLKGQFEGRCRFCELDPDQRRLLDVFLGCRGVLRDMEKVLNLSYPTVRSRVDGLLTALGYAPREEARTLEELSERRREVLNQLQAGEITPEEAATRLKALASD